MIQVASKELANAHYGNKQISKICKGNQILWENWKTMYGNPYSFLNVAIKDRWSVGTETKFSDIQWMWVLLGFKSEYSFNDYILQGCIYELKDYQNIKPLHFSFSTNDKYGFMTFNYTKFLDENRISDYYYVSEDANNWHRVSFNNDINYSQLGINYVRYVKVEMGCYPSSAIQGQTYTCNITCTKYLKRGN